MDRQIKQEFVRRVLNEQAKELDSRQTKRIEKYLKFRTGRLLNDRKVEVVAGSDSMDGRLTLTIPIHGRFLDMRRKSTLSLNRDRIKKRSYSIYNSPTMSVFNATGKKLMYFLTKEVAQQIKNDLSNQNI